VFYVIDGSSTGIHDIAVTFCPEVE